MFSLIKNIRHKMKRIQAKKHRIGTYQIDKISLSCFDDKRFVLDDGVHTLAYFHEDCNKKCDKNENKNKNENENENKNNHAFIMLMIMKNDNEKW